MSAIRRGVRPIDRFTVVSNDLARDHRLSFKARGIALYLLSHAEGWETSSRAIARESGAGRALVDTGLRELEALGYLRRSQGRTDDGRLGQAEYVVTCSPVETTSPDRGSISRGRVIRGRKIEPHKKNSSKNNITKKKTPSGGSLRDSPPTNSSTEEDPMRTTSVDLHQPALDLQLPAPEKKPGRKAEPGAGTVVAAFVDSYRKHHSGGDPTKAVIGRVARSAKAILTAGTAGPAELTAAATEMGTTPWGCLDTALAKHRQKGGSKMGTVAPVPPRGVFAAASNEADRQFREQLKADPELAAWIATDRAEVAKLIAIDPDLATVFAQVATA